MEPNSYIICSHCRLLDYAIKMKNATQIRVVEGLRGNGETSHIIMAVSIMIKVSTTHIRVAFHLF